MPKIVVKDLTFSYDTAYDFVFEHTSFDLDTDWKLGFIGRNGKGKTTFFRLLQGKYEYQGTIEFIGSSDCFPFEVKEQEKTVLSIIKEFIAPFQKWEEQIREYEGREDKLSEYGTVLELYIQHDGYQIDELIEREIRKLKLPSRLLETSFASLSGGEQTKVMLAALFLKKNQFLLLDEPTNHLDADGRRVVADYLKKQKKGFILISHDRSVLNEVVDHILSINRKTIDVIKGNYDSWKYQKDRKDQSEIQKNEALKKDIKRLEEASSRFAQWSDKIEAGKIGPHVSDRGYVGHQSAKMMQKAKNTKNRQEKSLTEKKELLKDIEYAADLKMNMLYWHSKRLIEAKTLSLYYQDLKICGPMDFNINAKDRIAFLGPNGCGKSSIIKLLLGEEIKYTGQLKVGEGLKISYVSQDTSWLKETLKTFAKQEGVDETIFKTVLHKLGFAREQYEKNMEMFSSGQKKKVLLAKSLAQPAHLFVWDEPLNFLDILSRIQIENLILSYEPTMLFVEHDRTFLERIATKKIQF